MLESLVLSRLQTVAADGVPGLAVQLPGGRLLGPTDAAVQLRLNSLAPLAHVATGQIGKLAEDYVEGRIEIDGAMRDVVAVAGALVRRDPTEVREPIAPIAWWRDLLLRGRSRVRHRSEADARQVQQHYDVSDDFYALWLDPRRVYSCAYFRAPGAERWRRRRRPSSTTSAASCSLRAGRALSRHRRRLGRACCCGPPSTTACGPPASRCRATSMRTSTA